MYLIYKLILNHFNYEEYISLIKLCPFLGKYNFNQELESKYLNQHNLYKINDYLPNNLIYKENLYFYIKLFKPIYFYLTNFSIIDVKDNFLLLHCKNSNYIQFFLKLQQLIVQSFKKNNYLFDTSIMINNDEIIIYLYLNESQKINIDYSSNNFLIKFIGVKLENYVRMKNNFMLVKSF
jgi:hypothetical protein